MSPREETEKRIRAFAFKDQAEIMGHPNPVLVSQYIDLRFGLRKMRQEQIGGEVEANFYWHSQDKTGADARITIRDGVILTRVPPQADVILAASPDRSILYSPDDLALNMLKTMGVFAGEEKGEYSLCASVLRLKELEADLFVWGQLKTSERQKRMSSLDQAVLFAFGCCPEDLLEEVRKRGLVVGVKRSTGPGTTELLSFATPFENKDGRLLAPSVWLYGYGDNSPQVQRARLVRAINNRLDNPVGIIFDQKQHQSGIVHRLEQVVCEAGKMATYSGFR